MNWPMLLCGPILVALLFLGWLGVQRLWARVFELPEHCDVLAGRASCANCTCATACQPPDKYRPLTENTHDR